MQAGSSRTIGGGFVAGRNAIARRLIAVGVTPNHVTIAGLFANGIAAVGLVAGAGHHASWEAAVPGVSQSYWPLWVCVWLFIAGACDMIDGAVARLGNLGTPFGGVLDSVVDRMSDMVLYGGLITHFALVGNITYVVLSCVALCNGLLISYAKARAEEVIDDCGVGFWQRGERSAAIFLAAMTGHLPIMLWQQAISPFFTFVRRVRHARAVLRARETGAEPPATLPSPGALSMLRPWRYPRGTIPYDVAVGLNIAFFVVLPWVHPMFYGAADPLGDWLTSLVSFATVPVS